MPETSPAVPTKQRILDAAVEVFTRQGYAATTTRDVAAAAGVNIATLHYHHRSKEELFGTVAARAMKRFNAVFDEVHAASADVRDFLRRFVGAYTELLLEYPYLAGFIQHESERAPAQFMEYVDFARWSREMDALVRADPEVRAGGEHFAGHLVANMVGALIYPFLFKTTTMLEFGMSEESWEGFVRERKRVIVAMVEGWLYSRSADSA